jgi:hypothetical protein
MIANIGVFSLMRETCVCDVKTSSSTVKWLPVGRSNLLYPHAMHLDEEPRNEMPWSCRVLPKVAVYMGITYSYIKLGIPLT